MVCGVKVYEMFLSIDYDDYHATNLAIYLYNAKSLFVIWSGAWWLENRCTYISRAENLYPF